MFVFIFALVDVSWSICPNIVDVMLEKVHLVFGAAAGERLPPTEVYGDAIVIPAILAENFELKHGLLNLVTSKQFYGFEKEDPHAHIRWFNKITSTIKYKDVPNSSIKLMLFPFSIEGAARIWLEKEPPRSILTWEDLVSKFINQFFPPFKTINLRNEILNFQQKFEETFSEAWDRFKDLLRACPHHGFTELHQLDTFYNALTPTDQDSLNAAAGGNLLTKTPRDALTIIENKSKVRNSRIKPVVSKVSANTYSSTMACPSEMAALTDAVNAMLRHVKTSPSETVKAISESCVTCGGPHPCYECLASYGNTFNASAAITTYNQNQGYRPQGDLNYHASNQMGPHGFPSVQNNQNRFNQNHGYNQNRGNNFNQGNQNYQAPPQVGPSNDLSNYMKTNDFFQTNTASSGSGSLPSNTVANPRGDLKAITTRSGISYDGPPIPPLSFPTSKVVEREPEVTRGYGCNQEIVECLTLADLGASINLMPLSIWKKLSLPELTPTRMILELADRSTTSPSGIAKDVFVKVGKFHFLADFVVVDYIVDPRVPLILGRPFLRMECALIVVYDEELTLRVDDEAITFKVGQTSRYSYNNAKSVNRIDVSCDEYAQEVLSFSDSSTSGKPTSSLDPILSTSFPSLTSFEGGDFILEEIKACLTNDSIPPRIDDADFDPEGDLLLLEKLLNDDPSSPLPPKELKFEELKLIKSSIDDPPELELKDLPSHLEYAFLEGIDKLPIIISKELKDEEKASLLKVLKSYKRAIAWKISDIKVIKLLDAGLIYPISDSLWVSPVHCVPKKGGMNVFENKDNELIPTRLVTGWRVCIDYQKLNDATHKDHFPLPFMDQMLERLAGNEYYCFLDGFSGYFQIPIDPQDQEKTTFTCPYGMFAYRRMPFGLCNAPGTFQRCMMAIFHDMMEEIMEVFMDDFSVFRDSFSSCLSHLDKMLKRCKDTNLVINWEKYHFMVKEGIVLGHKISKSRIEVDKAKVDVIAKLPHPNSVKGVQSFLGAVLGQCKTKHFQPIRYASKTMTDAQAHYTTTEKELLAVVYAFEKFLPYLDLSKTIVYTDHSALKYLLAKQDAKPRLLRWILLLQEFDVIIRDKKGAENLTTGHLSRLENPHQGPFPSSRGNKYILVAVDYLSKWVETKALLINDARVVVKFLKSFFAQFGTPRAIISDPDTYFCNDQFAKVMLKTVGENRASWSDKLDDALWAFRTTLKTPIGCTPYKLVYGKACHLPIELEHKTYWALKHCNFDLKTAGDHRKVQMNELNELQD
ncbi:reverse transcriptase domain-containing protein [Tanacetum coccineum]